MRPLDAWTIGGLLCGTLPDDSAIVVADRYRPLAEGLVGLDPALRRGAWEAFMWGQQDPDDLVLALAGVDPTGPPPATEVGSGRSFATLADIARVVANQTYLWPGWIAGGVLNALAAEPGTGKTRFALDLARRLWFGLPWPDGQPNHWPTETRTLWIQGDRNFAEMLQAARDFGLPEEAVALGSSPDDPTGGLDLDDTENLADLAIRIEEASPGLVIIDTVGMVTSMNLCRVEDARAFFAPIMELAAETGVAFLGLTHLSKEKQALGRRINEKARVLIMMTQPDPEGQKDRRRLWVDKTAIQKPPPLGITMGSGGNEYDSNPPSEPEQARGKPGPASTKRIACKAWLEDQLTPNPMSVVDARGLAQTEGFGTGMLYRAKEELDVEELVVDGRKWWKLSRTDNDEGAESVRCPSSQPHRPGGILDIGHAGGGR